MGNILRRKDEMKAEKFKIIFMALVVFLCIGCVAVGCSKEPNEEPDSSQKPGAETFAFLHEQMIMDVYSETTLAFKESVSGEVDWASSDPTIATATDGKVTSFGKEGKTVITASCGGNTAVCTVSVRDEENAPVLRLDDTELTLKEGSWFTLTVKVFFRGEDVTDQAVIFWSSDSDFIASVDKDGNIVANNEGETTVTVSASVFGRQAADVVTVRVVKQGMYFQSDTGFSYNVEAVDSDGDPTIVKPKLFVYGDKGIITDAEILYESLAPEVASVDSDGTITVHRAGEAEISLQYTDPYKRVLTGSLFVNASRAAFTLEQTIEIETARNVNAVYDFSPVGEVEAVEWKGVTLTAQYDVETKGLSLVKSSSLVSTKETWETASQMIIRTSCVEYTVPAKVCAASLSEIEDLELLQYTNDMFNSSNQKYMSGYYTLAQDLNGMTADGEKYFVEDATTGNCYWNDKVGFRGTFDGAGHTISNVIIGRNGLFGGIGSGAVIKNFNLTGVSVKPAGHAATYGYAAVLAGQIYMAEEIGNINIQVDSYEYYVNGDKIYNDFSGLICGRLFTCRNFHDIEIDASKLDKVENVFGVTTNANNFSCSNVKLKAKKVDSWYWTGNYDGAISSVPEGVEFVQV